MQLHLIHEEKFGELPKSISMNHCFDSDFTIISVDGDILAEGKNCIVAGSQDALTKWLKPYEYIWTGVGSPIFEQFETKKIK